MTLDANNSLPFQFVHLTRYLDELVPMKAQRGLASLDVTFTSIDVTYNYIAIGTNIGITYLYDRRTGEGQKLILEGSSQPVTCVRCLETVELMVAISTSTGLVVVFQISLLSSQFSNSPKMKRYVITDLHHHSVSCLEWSPNGMKLVSGDEKGVVGQTEMDYNKNISKSQILFKESHAIVQLCYQQKMLLVSTLQRTVLCNVAEVSVVVQVGQKDRKNLGKYGACFYTTDVNPRDIMVLASRPSLRLWKANVEGKVLETFIFKEDLLENCQILTLNHIRNVDAHPAFSKADAQFGELQPFGSGAVSWSARKLFVIEMTEPRLVARCNEFTNIIRVATCNDEVFVLETPRLITRIARSADSLATIQVSPREDSLLFNQLKIMPNALKDFEAMIKNKSGLNASSIFSMIKPSVSTFTTVVPEPETVNMVVAQQYPPLCDRLSDSVTEVNVDQTCTTENQQPSVDLGVPRSNGALDTQEETGNAFDSTLNSGKASIEQLGFPRYSNHERWQNNFLVEDEELDEGIVFERRNGKKGRQRNLQFEQGGSSAEKSDSSSQDSQSDFDGPSAWNGKVVGEALPETLVSIGQLDGLPTLPVVSSTREEKEKLLAKMLDLSALSPALEQDDSDYGPDILAGAMNPFSCSYNGEYSSIEPMETPESNRNATSAHFGLGPMDDGEDDVVRYDSSERTGPVFNNYEEILGSYLGYGPPSGSSNAASLPEVMSLAGTPAKLTQPTQEDAHMTTDAIFMLESNGPQIPFGNEPKALVTPCEGVWIQHKTPGNLQSLSVCKHYIVCTDVREMVYYSTFEGMGLNWHKADYLAKQMSVSPSGKRLWRIYHNSAYVLVEPTIRGPFGKKWLEVSVDAVHVSVNENFVWYATRTGDVYVQNLSKESTHGRPQDVSHPVYGIAQVACTQGVVWALTVEGKLLYRTAITSEAPFGKDWIEDNFHLGDRSLLTLAFGGCSSGWVIDDTYSIWFKPELAKAVSPSTSKTWWQVKMGEFVYQNTTALRNLTNTLIGSLHADHLSSMILRTGQPCVSCSELQMWIYLPCLQTLYTNNGDITGHHWKPCQANSICPDPKLMVASGAYLRHGAVWLWQQGRKVYCLSPTAKNIQNIDLPECFGEATKLHCISAAPETLWLLTDTGRIFIRKDISVTCLAGRAWTELDLTQISNHKLVHLSCGPSVVWACNHKGVILMRIGSLSAPSIHNLSPAWVQVTDDNVLPAAVPIFVKVSVGPLDYIVWAIDIKNNVYVREGIFPELLIGLGWVLVSGIKAISLAISEVAVYALAPNLSIYRRYNISRSNYIGDYWLEMPCSPIRLLSVTVDDKLWAVNARNQLVKHESHVLSGTDKSKETKHMNDRLDLEQRLASIEDGWEVI